MKVKGDDDDDGVMGKVPDKGRGSSERERESGKVVGKGQREKVAPDFHLNKNSRMH